MQGGVHGCEMKGSNLRSGAEQLVFVVQIFPFGLRALKVGVSKCYLCIYELCTTFLSTWKFHSNQCTLYIETFRSSEFAYLGSDSGVPETPETC